MNKFFSTLVATMVVANSIASVTASAVSVPIFNEYSISTRDVVNDIVVDGTTVSAGSLAVTVNISNNTGFSASSLEISLGDAYDAILNEKGMLVIENGTVLSDAHISGAVSEDFVFVAAASAEDNTLDGEMFTFYVSDNGDSNDDISVISADSNDINSIISSALNPQGSSAGFYRIGDVDNDDIISATDVSAVLSAINKTGRGYLPYSEAVLLPNYYFPAIYDINAAFIWNGNLDIDKEFTADVMLDFYICMATGQTYTFIPSNPNDTVHTNANLKIGFVRPSSNPTY